MYSTWHAKRAQKSHSYLKQSADVEPSVT